MPRTSENPMIGETLSHYRIVAKLGEGGMGIVYESEDTRLRRHFAASWEGFALDAVTRQLEAGDRECYFWGAHSGAELESLGPPRAPSAGIRVQENLGAYRHGQTRRAPWPCGE